VVLARLILCGRITKRITNDEQTEEQSMISRETFTPPFKQPLVQILGLAVFALFAWVIGPGCQTVFAKVVQQDELSKEDEQILSDTFLQKENSVFIPVPRDMLRPLIRANRAIKENEATRAVSLLGEVLSESTDEDYLVPSGVVDGLSVSLRNRAQRILGALPTKSRELYRLRYGVQAKRMLAQAIEEGDFEKVSAVMQRFFYTRSGFDASMILGHYHLDEGRPVAAANCFANICRTAEAREIHDPEASVLLAICWMLADAPDRAVDALENLRSRSSRNTIQFQGEPVRLYQRKDQAENWLLKLVGGSPLRNIDVVSQWLMSGGNPARNAQTDAGFPLLSPRWSVPTLNDPDLEKMVKDRMKELVFLDSSPIPSVQPLAMGDTIVMRAFDRMIGVDFATGKRKWVYPPWDFAEQMRENSSDLLKPKLINATNLQQRMWQDSLYGQSSSDGKRIFVIPNPGFVRGGTSTDLRNAGAMAYRPYNEIKAIDVEREGAFLWEIGGQKGLDEPKLAGAFFLGPPLPVGGELFAICLQKQDIKLAVLDAESGRLKWEQRLGTTENSRDPRTDQYRRLAGVTPSFAQGIIVCSTGTGALVAVDLSTRSLLWGYQYSSASRRNIGRIDPDGNSTKDPFKGLWRDSSIVISDGRVLYTPVDAQELICVDLQSGKPGFVKKDKLQTAKCDRKDSLYIASVLDGKIVLIGDEKVRAIELKSGEETWHVDIQEYGRPSGRGYANNRSYFFPTTKQRLVKINLETGGVEQVVQTNGILGNLICYRNEVISHGVDRVVSFPQDIQKRRILREAEADGELTPEMLYVKAQLLLQDGKRLEAIETIELSYEKFPSLPTKDLMLRWILDLIKDDFDTGIKLAEKHEAEFLEHFRFEYLAARIDGLISTGNQAASIRILFEMLNQEKLRTLKDDFLELESSIYDRAAIGIDAKDLQSLFAGKIEIRLDHWLASRVRTVFDSADEPVRKSIQNEVIKFAKSYGEGSPVVQHDVVRLFGARMTTPEFRVELAETLLKQDDRLRARHLLTGLADSPDPLVVAQILQVLTDDSKTNGANESALVQRLTNRLNTDFSDEIFGENQTTGRELATQISTSFPSPPDSRIDWNRGEVKTTATTVSRPTPMHFSMIELQAHDDAKYSEWSYRFYSQTGEFEIRDAYGNELHRFLLRRDVSRIASTYNSYVFGRISIQNKLAVVDIGTEIFLFDFAKLKTKKDPVLWNTSIEGGSRFQPVLTLSRMWGETRTTTIPRYYENRVHVFAPGTHGVCYLKNSQLVCLDLFSGKRIWDRTTTLQSSIIFGDQDNLVLWNPRKRLALFLDPAAGNLERTVKLPDEHGAVWMPMGSRVLVTAVNQATDAALNQAKETRSKTGDKKDGKNSPDGKPDNPMTKMVGVYDLIAQQFVWKRSFPMTARACRIKDKKIALLPPEGDLEIIDIATGKVDFKVPVEFGVSETQNESLRKRVTGIGVEVREGKYLIHFKRGDTRNRVELKSQNVDIRYLNYNDVMWVGNLFLVDPVKKCAVWDHAVQFDNFQIAQGQPNAMPFHLFARRVRRNGTTHIQFTGIDLETGRIAVNYMATYNYNVTFDITCDPTEQRVSIDYSNHSIDCDYRGRSDGPPRPLAHLTNANSVPKVKKIKTTRIVDQVALAKEKEKLMDQAKKFQERLEQRREEERKLLELEKVSKTP
jgi:outer membrane protein assembly factor BamB